jgi:hypothetical protein
MPDGKPTLDKAKMYFQEALISRYREHKNFQFIYLQFIGFLRRLSMPLDFKKSRIST